MLPVCGSADQLKAAPPFAKKPPVAGAASDDGQLNAGGATAGVAAASGAGMAAAGIGAKSGGGAAGVSSGFMGGGAKVIASGWGSTAGTVGSWKAGCAMPIG